MSGVGILYAVVKKDFLLITSGTLREPLYLSEFPFPHILKKGIAMLTLCFFPFQNDHHQQQYFHFMMHFEEPEFWSTPENMFIDS